ncbi:MAG TPA: response regulator [Vicinamibacterales bacterium]
MILVIDDFAPQRYVRRRTLEEAGFAVSEAASAEEARQLVATKMPSLVLSDVGLRDSNGIALCAELKRLYPALPVVLVTESYRGLNVRQDAMAAGADAFLTEPVPRDQLLRVVRKVGHFTGPDGNQ